MSSTLSATVGLDATVLLIGESKTIREDVQTVLKNNGFKVELVLSATLALERLDSSNPDLIVCERHPPDMDGFGVLQTLKAHPACSDIPFILLCREISATEVRQAMIAGAEDFLTEPISHPELVATIKTHLRRKWQRQEREQAQMAELCMDIAAYLPHELLTPLNSMVNMAELMATELPSLSQEDLKIISKTLLASSNRLLERVREFLFYERLNLHSLRQRPLSASYPLQDLHTAPILRANAEDIAEQYHRLDDLSLILCESKLSTCHELLIAAFRRILDNAFKFSPAGSQVEIKSSIAHGIFHIDIRDQGRSMTHAQILQLAPLKQFDRQHHEQQGTGLGLATTRLIQQILNGHLHLEPGPICGLHVQLSFPTNPTSL